MVTGGYKPVVTCLHYDVTTLKTVNKKNEYRKTGFLTVNLPFLTHHYACSNKELSKPFTPEFLEILIKIFHVIVMKRTVSKRSIMDVKRQAFRDEESFFVHNLLTTGSNE